MAEATKTKAIRILVDTQCLAGRFQNHGIYQYARHLLTQFRVMALEHSAEVLPFVCHADDNDANQFRPAPGFTPVEAGLLRLRRLWTYGGACLSSYRQRADVVFCPSFTSLHPGPRPVVTTIHDATPVVMPTFAGSVTLKMRFQMWNAAKFSRAIITDSEWSRQDVIRLYGLPPAKVSVVYLGYDKDHFNTRPADPRKRAELLKAHGIERPFVLHHGVIQPRKNLQRLVQAYRLLLSRRPGLELDLVLAGPKGWLFEEIMEEIRSGAVPREKIILTGALSDADLGMLIKSARLVAIPSLYEGFCLPMVEAMACGVPTIASSASCLPEISGGTLRYFDPLSVEEMAVQMETALLDDGLRADLTRKGLERAASFDWRRCAEQTLELLVRVGQNGKADRN